jgi:2-amino-4-hydroxy-6-hydroxymethyldihydropteridine diphosphokinase
MNGLPQQEIAYIALGSNMGNRQQQLLDALHLIDADEHIRILRVSGIYETAPVGYIDQPPFLNMVVAVVTSYESLPLLLRLLDIEQRLGRKRDIYCSMVKCVWTNNN